MYSHTPVSLASNAASSAPSPGIALALAACTASRADPPPTSMATDLLRMRNGWIIDSRGIEDDLALFNQLVVGVAMMIWRVIVVREVGWGRAASRAGGSGVAAGVVCHL